MNERGNSGRRTALLAAGLLVALALVGFAAGERWRGGDSRAAGSVPAAVVDAMFVVGAMLAAVTIVLFALVYGGAYGSISLERKRSPTMRVVTSVAIVIVTIFAVAAIRKAWREQFGDDGPAQAEELRRERQSAAAADRAGERTLDWWLVGGAFTVALIGSAYAARLALRNAHEPAPEAAAAALAAVLADTLDDLRAERDPRRAVVAAYARMERALAANGLPRRPAEAPLEYLERALEALSASASSASRLTRLFEWARFSDHAVPTGMKEEAIAALEAVRAELAAPRVYA